MDLEAKVTILQLNAQGRQVGRAISKGRVLCFLSRNENGIVTVSAPTTQVGVKGAVDDRTACECCYLRQRALVMFVKAASSFTVT